MLMPSFNNLQLIVRYPHPASRFSLALVGQAYMSVYIASFFTNTNQDIHAEPLMGAGTVPSRIHALARAQALHSALLLLRAESYLCVRYSVVSLL